MSDQPPDLTTALEERAQAKPAQTVLELLQRSRLEVEKALPAGTTLDHFERCVRTEIRRTPKLLDCDPYSLLGAVMYAAQLGLEPGPLGHVYLVPFKHEVAFIIGYRGFVDLAYRSGQVKAISAATVREGDAFSFRYGTRPFLDHTPDGPPNEREPVAYYAVAQTKQGGAPFVVIYPEDVERARARSKASGSAYSPWNTDYDAMARKTAVRWLAPLLPVSPLAAALEKDEALPQLGAADLLGNVDA